MRTSIFVSGCRHHCPGCFNEVAWDFGYGQPFDKAVRNEIFASCQPDYIAGISLLGGEPFEPENQRELLPFVRNFRALYPDMTFALGKGRLAKKTLELFEKIGITCDEIHDPDTRKLIFVNEELGLRFFLAKGPDVPTYVEYGAADIGIVGKDTILEEGRNIYEVLDLGFGKCRMCICGPKDAEELLKHHELIRVATKYPHIAKDYFYNKKHQTVEIIKLNGSIELAPIVGLSEVICDIVETGSTLRENGLVVLEEVCPLSARMVVNQVSMKMENERITKLIADLKREIERKDLA